MNDRMTMNGLGEDVVLSADSHIAEPFDLWETRLPEALRARAPRFPGRKYGTGLHTRTGGWDPSERLKDMAIDGVSGEVVYPTLGLWMYAGDDVELEEACFAVYNDWLSEYCQAVPDRLWGLAMISLYDIDNAVKEMERTRKQGLLGATIWQTPPEHLPFSSDHYDGFWAAAQDLEMPVSLHILTGHGRTKGERGPRDSIGQQRSSVNYKQLEVANAALDIIDSGVFDRFPRLKVVLAENDAGWIPYWLQQADFNVQRWPLARPLELMPSEYFYRQMYASFIEDPAAGYLVGRWGQDNFMWSSDYPHTNGIWPRSQEIIAWTLAHLNHEVRAKVVCHNVARLYNVPIPSPISTVAVNEAERDALLHEMRPWLPVASSE